MASVLDSVHETVTPYLAPYFEKAGLPALSHHWYVLVGSFLFWHLVMFVSARLSPLVAPSSYPPMTPIRKLNWNIHVVSMVHCLTVIVLAIKILGMEELQSDRLFSYHPFPISVYAFTCGYFLWDALISLRYVRQFGVSFLVHGVVCFSVFIFCFRPFVTYYGAVFLLYELSTPFLNVHWFMDKIGMTGTVWQAINGVCLISTFFFARIVFGTWKSIEFLTEIVERRSEIPTGVFMTYFICNIAMGLLNLYWFRAMVATVLARFQKPTSVAKKSDGVLSPAKHVANLRKMKASKR